LRVRWHYYGVLAGAAAIAVLGILGLLTERAGAPSPERAEKRAVVSEETRSAAVQLESSAPAETKRQGRVSGLVVEADGETIVPGASVEIVGHTIGERSQDGWRPLSCVADDRGFFLFENLPLEECRLKAGRGVGISMGCANVRLDAQQSDVYVVIRLPRAYVLKGWVQDESGAAIEGARVEINWLKDPPPGIYRDQFTIQRRTDAGGSFEFQGMRPTSSPEFPGDHYAVSARHPNYHIKFLDVQIAEGQDPPPITFVLRRAPEWTKITGRLLKPDGTPASGMDVDLVTYWEEPGGKWVEAGGGFTRVTPQARTNAEGAFEFQMRRGSPTWNFFIDVTHPDWAPLRFRPRVEPGMEEDVGDLVLEEGYVSSGVVIDMSGKPVHEARVYATFFLEDVDPMKLRQETDDQGRFSFRLAPGRIVEFRAIDPGNWTCTDVPEDPPIRIASPVEGMVLRVQGHSFETKCSRCKDRDSP
jgi:protocatechuate 3,4-dioxygenase beta subunit